MSGEGEKEEEEEEGSSGRISSPSLYCLINLYKERREMKRTRVEIEVRIATDEVKAKERENSKV